MSTEQEVREHYPYLLDLITQICRPVLDLPLAELASVNEQMQALAPVLEPTAYQRGGYERLREQRQVIDALLALQRTLSDLRQQGGRS